MIQKLLLSGYPNFFFTTFFAMFSSSNYFFFTSSASSNLICRSIFMKSVLLTAM